MHKTITSVIALTAAAAFSPAVSGGTYVESVVSTRVTAQAQSQTAKMWIGGGRFRLELQNGRQVQLFRDQAIYSLDVQAKRYSKVDKASLDEMTRKADEVMQQLRDLMPSDQKARSKQEPPSAVPQNTVKPTARTETAAGLSCKVWEVFAAGNKTRELCVVDIGSVPNGKEIIQTMQNVSDAFKGTAAASMDSWADMQKVNGFPVITRVYLNGKLFQESRTAVIRAAQTPDSMFVIPAGFQEQKIDASL